MSSREVGLHARRRALHLLLTLAVAGAALAARRPPRPAETAVVARVIDGDTFQLADGRKVRLLGVDAPELHHPNKPVHAFGAAARDFAASALAGRSVRLVFEKWNPVDKYGRLLAYVFRDPDGLFFNRELVAAGFGHVEVRWPFARMEEFRAAEAKAREEGRGLWATPASTAAEGR